MQRAVQGVPRISEHFFSYAVFLEEHMQATTSAQMMYVKALELEPSHAGALVNMGTLLVTTRNDTDTAHQLFTLALAQAPASSDAAGISNNLGLLGHQKAMRMHAKCTKPTYQTTKTECESAYFGSLALLEEALLLDPASVCVKNNLALMKAHLMHEDTRAETLFNEALLAEPSNIGVLSNLGLLVCSSGQLRKADAILMRALTLNPSHAAAAQNVRFVRRLMDKQRMHQLAQRHRLQYPTAQYGRTVPPSSISTATAPIAGGATRPLGTSPTSSTPHPNSISVPHSMEVGVGWQPAERGAFEPAQLPPVPVPPAATTVPAPFRLLRISESGVRMSTRICKYLYAHINV